MTQDLEEPQGQAIQNTYESQTQPQGQKWKPSSADMQHYYERLLPFRYVFQWLSHSPKPTKDFTMREFAYEHRSGAYQRYNSFESQEEFKKSVVNANPTRFEIGAVYTVNPKERRNLPKNALKPISKELVFDIDLTDYDDIRTCCQGTDICMKCWKFIRVGSKIIESALRDDFGFKHLVWVFSGRRGAHCWISDSRARNLDELTRKAIVEYMDVLSSIRGNNKFMKKIKKPYHPHVERSFNYLKQEFIDIILEDQEPWLTSSTTPKDAKAWTQIEELLSFIPEKSLQIELRNKWINQNSLSTSKTKWEDINEVAKRVLKTQIQVLQLNEAKKDIIIYYMYPRLDVEVSRQMIHLLKSPFCIHPGTGNVCVPFDPSKNISNNSEDDEYGFNPTTAPNLKLIQSELEEWDRKPKNSNENENEKRLADYEKTSLKPYIDYFAKFVNELIKEELSGKRSREDDSLEF
ncbi:uncharacterized protein RJT21DRAFT_119757 [Scheffersomyces amazonensis]|uniref:uncharacterized protein n=1 Tax=Scheffersomyces amazonensis TaxID=1078765 RepID=UPI00315DD6D3